MGDQAKPKHFPLRKANCSECSGIRNCDILGEYDDLNSDEYMSWSTHWYLLRCRGCEHIFAQTVGTNSEDIDYHYEEDGSTGGNYIEIINYWPALSKRPLPDWLYHISVEGGDISRLTDSLDELYGALNNDLNILAGIGIRTSFDIAAELLGIDKELTFKGKLDELIKADHIGQVDLARIETLVSAGSASAHRGWKPAAEDLDTMMEVLEHFIHTAFVAPAEKKRLDEKAAAVSGKVPKRKKSAKKAAASSKSAGST